jgi:alpha(1,3/1,4) fucosyltransferase
MNFTWDDDIVRTHKNYKKITEAYERILPDDVSVNDFPRLKFITTIASNKQSKEEGELYSERKKAIEYFLKKPEGFDLYGMGWGSSENNAVKETYRGTVERKIDVLKKYKFCLSYENTSQHNGYICEKIFDCFRAGCVPIYYGAKNISSYIPEDCFIDFRKFVSYEEMYKFLINFNERDYLKYISAIKAFLISNKYDMFTSESHVKILMEEIESINAEKQKARHLMAVKIKLIYYCMKNILFFVKNILTYKKFLFDILFSF